MVCQYTIIGKRDSFIELDKYVFVHYTEKQLGFLCNFVLFAERHLFRDCLIWMYGELCRWYSERRGNEST